MRELEERIAAWRAEAYAALSRQPEVMHEMEEHLRDSIEGFLRQNMTPLEAFERARRQLGNLHSVEREFRRLELPWFGRVTSRRVKMLGYAGGTLAMATLFAYLRLFVRCAQTVLTGNPNIPIPLLGLALSASVICLCAFAIRACGRLLESPNVRDLRGLIAFSLLVIWMLAGDRIFRSHHGFEIRLMLVWSVFSGLVLLWRVGTRNLERRHFERAQA